MLVFIFKNSKKKLYLNLVIFYQNKNKFKIMEYKMK